MPLDAETWIALTAQTLTVLVVAGAILYAGYTAYEARKARERLATEPRPVLPDPVLELQVINAKLQAELATAAETLEKTRETIRRGTKG